MDTTGLADSASFFGSSFFSSFFSSVFKLKDGIVGAVAGVEVVDVDALPKVNPAEGVVVDAADVDVDAGAAGFAPKEKLTEGAAGTGVVVVLVLGTVVADVAGAVTGATTLGAAELLAPKENPLDWAMVAAGVAAGFTGVAPNEKPVAG